MNNKIENEIEEEKLLKSASLTASLFLYIYISKALYLFSYKFSLKLS